MKREEIRIRDPFILPYEGKYYMYGTGIPGAEDIDAGRQFWCYVSRDLEEWSEPILCFDAPDDFWGEKNFWAPEVHIYKGKFYLLGTFMADGKMRATQALVSDKPEGPFRVFGKPLTPEDWMCLDGTLYIEDGNPYLVFCHEWLQVGDGEIAMIPLKEDLSEPAGEATVLFAASEGGWAHVIDIGTHQGIVTDGPWIVKEDDELLMFWSSFHHGTYAVGMSVSESGKIAGPWRHLDKLLFEKDGGHGMMFETFEGQKLFVLHQPNCHPDERAHFYEVVKDVEGYRLLEKPEQLLKKMTIDEKIGQLVQYNANVMMDTSADVTGPRLQSGLSDEQIHNIGSVLNFKTPLEVRAIQDKHLENDRHKIPMLFMMDVIHGFRTIFPIPLGLGCTFNPDLVGEAMKMSAREAVAGGVHVTFTPMVDYVRDARWGRVMETCGEDVLLNSVMGAAQVKAFQGDGDYANNKAIMPTCVKHFAAYGGAEAGRDYAQVELSEHILREFYLPAYKACIDAGTEMLMPSFNVLNGVPAVANKWLMKNILRDEWKFDGLVISDYNAIGELNNHGITDDMKEASRLAFENGCHIDMCASAYSHHLKVLVEEGTIPMELLDDAVYRVLDLKNRMGLFEDPYRGASTLEEPEEYLTEENRHIARRTAEEAAVLLKNNGILPLSTEVKKIALIGPMADEHAIIGFWSCNGVNEESVTIKEGLERLLPNAEITYAKGCGNAWDDYDTSGFTQAKDTAKEAEVVILCVGEPQDYSGEGNSRADITLTGVQSMLAKEIAAVNPNVVAVTFSGRPLAIPELDTNMAAILHMWFPGTEGGNAVANLLFGKANPSGKLSMSFPKATGQCPIYYNHTNTGRPKPVDREDVHCGYTSNYIGCGNLPLYSFGYGLSYSDFVYEGMELSSDTITVDEPVTVKITVRNNSKIDGKETVMLYMRDVYASNSRPVQQLIVFEKVELAAGEVKVVEFTIEESMLRFWNNEHKFVSESGLFKISTGYADHLIYTTDLELQRR